MAGRSVINVLVNGDMRGLTKSLDTTAGKIGTWSTDITKKLGAISIAAGAAAVALGKKMADAASDLEEATSKVGVVFGDVASQVTDFARVAEEFGVSRTAALDAAAGFAVFGHAAGLAGDDLVGFSTDFVRLAADLASFNNTTPQEAIEAIGAALRGESEPLRRYGVMLNDATLKDKAFEMGIYSGKGALDSRQKTLAAEIAIYEQTAHAQGDFARTSDGLANTQRVLSARLTNTVATLGQQLLPVALEVVTAFSLIIDRVTPLAQRYLPPFVEMVRDVAGRVGEFARELAERLTPHLQAMGDWIRENSDTVRVFFAVLAGAAVVAGVVALGAAIASMMNPITLAVVAIAALAAGVHYAYRESETFREIVDTVVRFFRDTVVPGFVAAFGAVRGAIESFVAGFRSRMDDIRSAMTNIGEAVAKILDIMQRTWERFGDNVLRYIGRVFDSMRQIIEGALAAIRGVVDLFLGVLSGNWGRAWDGIKQIVSGALDTMRGVISGALAPLQLAWDNIMDVIKLGIGTARDFIRDAIDRIVGFITGIPGRISSAASGMFDGIAAAFRAAINTILRGWNAIEFRIPGFKIGPVGYSGFTLGLPDIPYLAQGGLVMGPTLAVVGEAGPEMVVPLNKTGMMGNTYNITVTSADPQAVVDAIRRYNREQGPAPIKVAS